MLLQGKLSTTPVSSSCLTAAGWAARGYHLILRRIRPNGYWGSAMEHAQLFPINCLFFTQACSVLGEGKCLKSRGQKSSTNWVKIWQPITMTFLVELHTIVNQSVFIKECTWVSIFKSTWKVRVPKTNTKPKNHHYLPWSYIRGLKLYDHGT